MPRLQVQEGLNVLRLRRPDKKVGWSEDTVDNEGMDKKKSKCCCVYKKPMQFGESSSETDDECENCFGHVEVKKKHRMKKKRGSGGGGGEENPDNGGNDKNSHHPHQDPHSSCNHHNDDNNNNM